MPFEGPDAVGNGRRRDVQFDRGVSEAPMAGRGLEESQALKRGQSRQDL